MDPQGRRSRRVWVVAAGYRSKSKMKIKIRKRIKSKRKSRIGAQLAGLSYS
jgi:hypothetical protein